MQQSTDKHIYDSEALSQLVENIIKSDNIQRSAKLYTGDGEYKKVIFSCLLVYNGFIFSHKVRNNA